MPKKPAKSRTPAKSASKPDSAVAVLDAEPVDAAVIAYNAAQQVATERPTYILDCAQVIAEHDAQLRAMSPPCKLTPVVAVKLLNAIRQGAHYETACAHARISYETFVAWRNRAEDDAEHGPWSALMQALKLAEADAELETLSDVRLAAKEKKFWAAGMTFLERRHPDRWKRRDDSQVQVNVGIALGIQASDEQRKALLPAMPIAQIARENADRPALETPASAPTSTPTFASSASLSPVPRND